MFSNLRSIFSVDAYITEEETEALMANNTTSLFVGNVRCHFFLCHVINT